MGGVKFRVGVRVRVRARARVRVRVSAVPASGLDPSEMEASMRCFAAGAHTNTHAEKHVDIGPPTRCHRLHLKERAAAHHQAAR